MMRRVVNTWHIYGGVTGSDVQHADMMSAGKKREALFVVHNADMTLRSLRELFLETAEFLFVFGSKQCGWSCRRKVE